MTDAQAMNYAPPGEEPSWGMGGEDDGSDNEETLDWSRPDAAPGAGPDGEGGPPGEEH